MKEILQDLKELTQHFKLPIWVITLLIYLAVIGLVILWQLVDNVFFIFN
jgi:hypothetical protein